MKPILWALILGVAGTWAAQTEDSGLPYANELRDFRFYNIGRWRMLAPGVSTMADVRIVLGAPDQERDVADYTSPYPGDDKARKPVFSYSYGPDWELLVYFARYCFYVLPPNVPGDSLCSLELVPKRPRSFQSVKFPPVFRKSHVTAVDAAWDEYSDGSGLVYEVYTTPGPYGREHAGGLNRIVYGPPGGGPERRLVAAGGCYSDCARSEPPPCAAAWEPYSSVIFLGTPIDVKNSTRPSDRVQRLTVTFRVDEAFRGVSGGTVTATTGGVNCGFPFSTTMQYLVYATRQPDGPLSVDSCGATKWASRAAADLAYLRHLPVPATAGVISGAVYRYVAPPRHEMVARLMKAVAGQVVKVRGPETYVVKTDARGMFRVDGVKPGGYEIRLDVADPVRPNPVQFVRVFGPGCSEATFQIDPFASVDF